MRNAIHFLGGSFTVYALMAACSAGGKGKPRNGEDLASSGGAAMQATGGVNTSSGGADGASGGNEPTAGKSNGMGGIIGEMMDPVPDAEAETSGTRLKARYYVGEDGSRQFVGWRDTMRDEDCSFWPGIDGVVRCMPSYGVAVATFFADAACSQPVALVAKATGSACGVTTPTAKYAYFTDACGANRQRFSVSPQTAATVFQKAGATCNDVTAALTAAYDFYTMTSPTPAPDSAFVAVTEQVE